MTSKLLPSTTRVLQNQNKMNSFPGSHADLCTRLSAMQGERGGGPE
jgi:hypothetical protein